MKKRILALMLSGILVITSISIDFTNYNSKSVLANSVDEQSFIDADQFEKAIELFNSKEEDSVEMEVFSQDGTITHETFTGEDAKDFEDINETDFDGYDKKDNASKKSGAKNDTGLLAAPDQLTFSYRDLINNGPDSENYCILIAGDGYTSGEQEAFLATAQRIANYFLTKEPFSDSNIRSKINIRAVCTVSNVSGVSMDPDNLYDTFFKSSFNNGGVERLVCIHDGEALSNVINQYMPECSVPIVVCNSEVYGGSGGSVCTISNHSASTEIAVHEFGHTGAGLADEYWEAATVAGTGFEAPNRTSESNPSKCKWSDLIGVNGVGLYAFEENASWYRPHQNCEMRYLNREFCEVCKRQIRKSISETIDKKIKDNETIYTADDLKNYASRVASGSSTYNKTVTLAEDINLTGTNNISAMTNFNGTFNGNGHSIRGLNIRIDDNIVGFIRTLGNTGTIMNLSIEDATIIGTGYYTGGFVGNNNGTVYGCSFSGHAEAYSGAGGIVGHNAETGVVHDCYNLGTVYASNQVSGGVIGWVNGGTVNNCYNYGKVTVGNSWYGAVAGYQPGGVVSNCYYLEGTAGEGIAGQGNTNAKQKTAAEFSNGTVTQLLNNVNNVWKQGDTYPVFNYITGGTGGGGEQQPGNTIYLNGTNSSTGNGLEGNYSFTNDYVWKGNPQYSQADNSYKYLVLTYTGDITDLRIGNDSNPPTAVYWFASGHEDGTNHSFVTPQGTSIPANGNNTTVVIDLAKSSANGNFFKSFHIHTGASGKSGNVNITSAYLSQTNPSGEVVTEAPTQQPATEAPTEAPTQTQPTTYTNKYQQYGYTLNITQTTGSEVGTTIIDKMKEIYFNLYPHMRQRYNTARPKAVNLVFDPGYDGVAYTSGSTIVVSVDYIKAHQADVDCFTHELFHVAQGGYMNYGSNSITTAFCEGMADYARFHYGIYNSDSNWGLQNYNSSQLYTGSYGITGNFILWISQNYDSEIGYYINKAMHESSYTDSFWTQRTGKTLDELWSLYAASPSVNNVKFNAYKGEVWGIESGKAYKIISAASGKALSVAGDSLNDRANIEQRTYVNGNESQQWIFNYIGNGKYNIVNKKSGKVLDVDNSGTTNFTNIQQYTLNGSEAQQWVPVEQGLYYALFAVNGNGTMVADLNSSSQEENANISIYTWNKTKAQKYLIVPVDQPETIDYSLNAFERIEAEDFTSGSTNISVSIDENSSRSGGANVGGLWAGAWIMYDDVKFNKVAEKIRIHSCNPSNESYVNVYVDSMNSQPVAKITIPHNSSDWNNYGTYEATLTGNIPIGTHDVYLEFKNDAMNGYAQNCDYFTFIEKQEIPTEAPTEKSTEKPTEAPTEAPTQTPKYTVTVDGAVAATVDKGTAYTFPTASKIGYYGDGKLYKPGSTYTVNKDVTFSSVKFAAAKTPGLRYTKPAGLSYQGKISCSDASVFDNAITETGVLAVTNDRLGNGAELTIDSKVGYVNLKVTSWLNNVAGSFSTSFAGIKENNYERDFVLRGYMLVNYADGTKATIYTTTTTPTSVSELAYKVFKNKTQYNAMSAANKQLILEYMGIE